MQSKDDFNISEVCQQTGVAAVTLRAWERRYGLIKPKRTPKGHRLYSQKNIEQIQQIVNWLNRGVSISKVAALLSANESMPENKQTDEPWQQAQQELSNFLIALKQRSLNPLLDKLNKSMPFVSLCEYVYQPLHNKLATRWQSKPLGYQLEQQLWQQCWQRQITLLTLRADKQKQHASYWLINLDQKQSPLDYWLFYGLLLQSGIQINAVNQLDELGTLTRVKNSIEQPIIIFGDNKVAPREIEQLAKIKELWQADLMIVGHMAKIHADVITRLGINHSDGSASECWQSSVSQSWLTKKADSKKINRQLVWFRNDFRVSDNPALFHAREGNEPIIAIYIANPEQWIEHDDAVNKIDFWRRNLQCLQETLSELNISLHYFQVASYQQVPSLIASICQQWQIKGVHFSREYPLNEQRRDKRVIEACEQISVQVHSYDDQLLLPPKSIRTKAGEPFKVFTPFAKQVRQQMQEQLVLLPQPSQQQAIDVERLPEELDLDQISWPSVSEFIQLLWPAGESEAMASLIIFCDNKIHGYKKNRDIPSVSGTSQLAAYLASGIISIKQCWHATVQYCEHSDSVIVWQNELLWREFYKHILIDYPQISQHKPWKPHTDKIKWRNDESELKAWQQGKTGFPIIDAAMRQLLKCGWMHNRLRMITAMFLSKHLLIDWRLGERWFMQHLIDGELAANNGGWQWCASTGTDSVPYFRLFNPVTQSKRFDPQGKFIREYLPELSFLSDKEIHLPIKNRPQEYPPPIIDLTTGRARALAEFKRLSKLSIEYY